MSNRPEHYTNEQGIYLDELRESGEVNMFGARDPLMSAFPELSRKQAQESLMHYMKTGDTGAV